MTELGDNGKAARNASLIAALLLAFSLFAIMQFGMPNISQREGGLTGKSVSQVYIYERFADFNCSNLLQDSWNLISMPCETVNLSISNITASISSYYVSLHRYNSTVYLDKWKANNPSIDSFALQDLQDFANYRGYWIKVSGSTTFHYVGNITLPNFIALDQGWNLFGWTSNETKNITLALASIDGKYTSVYAYFANDTFDPWKVYNPSLNPGLSDLQYLVSYYGYWINMTEAATLQVI